MEWVIMGIMAYVIWGLHERVRYLEDGTDEPSVIPESESLLDPVDIAARAVDRHVQDYHNGGI